MLILAAAIQRFRDFYEVGLTFLDEERRAKTLRYCYEDDRLHSLCAGLLLHKYVGHTTCQIGSFGKPYCPGGPCFSISHAGDYTIVAIHDKHVGVDIEPLRNFEPNVAKAICQEPELNWLYEDEPDLRFYQIWTRKESIMKACGHGLVLPATSFSVLPLEAEHLWLDDTSYGIQTIAFRKHIISAAVKDGKADFTLIETLPDDLLGASFPAGKS
jgi:4'-phosphopantetheinyl transferase